MRDNEKEDSDYSVRSHSTNTEYKKKAEINKMLAKDFKSY